MNFLNLAGGPYMDPTLGGALSTDAPDRVETSGDDFAADTAARRAAGDAAVSAALAEPPPFDQNAAMAALGMPTSPDADPVDNSRGGGTISDPAAAAAAAERSKEIPSESMTITANRTLPKIRGFTDQTFVLMHAMNLINLRNEKVLDLEEFGEEKGKDADVITNTVRSLKHQMPFAYMPTVMNRCFG